MKNLFTTADKLEIVARINALTPDTQRLWGKMNVAQMLKHSSAPLEQALTNPKPKRALMGRIIGPLLKGTVIGEKPFKKNSPTAPDFKVESTEDFAEQRSRLLKLIADYTPGNVHDKVHPFFGRLSDNEWGSSQYKHLDHHLTQFGV